MTVRERGPDWIRDPGLRAAATLFAAGLAGLAGLGLAWAGVAGKLSVPMQLPFVVSGGVGGVALTGAAWGLLAIQLERRAAASERAALEAVVRDAAEFAERLRARPAPARRRPRPARLGRRGPPKA